MISAKESPEAGSFDGDTANDNAGDSETDEAVEASWFAPAANLTVASGAASAAGAAIRIRQADEDGQDLDCDVHLDVSDLAPAEVPTASVYFWWELANVVPTEDACVGSALPATLGIGIGVLDPESRARLGTVEREDEADAMYGAWTRIDGGAILAIGFAAPTDTTLPASEAPPDDAYELEPLFLLPVSE